MPLKLNLIQGMQACYLSPRGDWQLEATQTALNIWSQPELHSETLSQKNETKIGN